MKVLDSVTTSDDYTDAATIANIWPSNGGSLSVFTEAVYLSTQSGDPSLEQWSPDIPIDPATGLSLPAGTTGVKFKSYKKGTPATVTAWIAGKYDAAPSGGTPGKLTVTNMNFDHNGTLIGNEGTADFVDATGILWTIADNAGASKVTVQAKPNLITGIIPAAGTTPTAGTGFTYTHVDTSGSYTFTFTNPFAGAPTIICQLGPGTLGSGYEINVTAASASGFTAFVDTGSGPGVDHAFMFIAMMTL